MVALDVQQQQLTIVLKRSLLRESRANMQSKRRIGESRSSLRGLDGEAACCDGGLAAVCGGVF